MAVDDVQRFLRQGADGFFIQRKTGPVAEEPGQVEAWIADHGKVIRICYAGVGRRADRYVSEFPVNDLRVIEHAGRHPVDDGREGVIHQADIQLVHSHFLTEPTGRIFQISAAYSRMVRSEEKTPAPAML